MRRRGVGAELIAPVQNPPCHLASPLASQCYDTPEISHGESAMDTVSRRDFLAGGALLLTARSYSRILGANDRIQIGQIGCGHRAAGHRQMLRMSAETDPNF